MNLEEEYTKQEQSLDDQYTPEPQQEASLDDQLEQQEDYDTEAIAKQAALEAISSITPGLNPGIIDKAARIASGTIGFLKNFAVDAPKAVSYWAASKFFDDEEIDSPEERKALMLAAGAAYDSVVPGSKVIEDLANQASESLDLGIDQHGGKDFVDLAEQGEYIEAGDAFLGDVASALPSVGAAFLGPGGLALIGGSVFGSKTKEGVESDTEADTDRILLNAASSAGGEILSEAFTAGLGGGLTKLAKKLGPKAAKAILRNTGSKLAFSFTGEGLSEVAAEAWDKAGDLALLGDDEAFDGAVRDFGKTFLLGGAIGGGIGITQLNNSTPPGVSDAVKQHITPQKIKESRMKSAAKINELEAELYDAQVNGEEVLERAIRDELKYERRLLKESQVATDNTLQDLSESQVKELSDAQHNINEYERLLKEGDLEGAAESLIRRNNDKQKEIQDHIFDNPNLKDIQSKNPVDKATRKKGEAVNTKFENAIQSEEGLTTEKLNDITEDFRGSAVAIANRRFNEIPKDLRRGTFDEFVNHILYGKRGIQTQIKGHKGTAPLAAFVNKFAGNRAIEVKKLFTAETSTSIDNVSDSRFTDDVQVNTHEAVANLGIPPSIVDESTKAAEHFELGLEGVKTPKDYAKKQKNFFTDRLTGSIRKFLRPAGSQTEKIKKFNGFLRKNADGLKDLFISSPDFKKARRGATQSWDANTTNQEFYNYFTGKDLDLSIKNDAKTLTKRKEALEKNIAESLGQKAWNDYLDANPKAKARVNEITKIKFNLKSEQIKPGSTTDYAFQEDTQPADDDFAAQSQATNKVLEANKQNKMPDSKKPDEYNEMRDWVGETMSQYFPKSFFNSGGFWNAGTSAAKRGFFFETQADFDAHTEGLKFGKDTDIYSKAQRYHYKKHSVEKILKDKSTIEARNNTNQAAFNQMWKTFDKMIADNPANARYIAAFLKSAQNSQNHYSRIGAPLVAYSKTGPYTEEHAMPQSAVSRYLLNTLLTGGDINSALKNTNKNFVQVALNAIDDASLKKNKIGPNGSNLNSNMPAGWKPSDNWLARYFNTTSSIDPSSIVFLDSGKTVLETYLPSIKEHRKKGEGKAADSDHIRSLANLIDKKLNQKDRLLIKEVSEFLNTTDRKLEDNLFEAVTAHSLGHKWIPGEGPDAINQEGEFVEYKALRSDKIGSKQWAINPKTIDTRVKYIYYSLRGKSNQGSKTTRVFKFPVDMVKKHSNLSSPYPSTLEKYVKDNANKAVELYVDNGSIVPENQTRLFENKKQSKNPKAPKGDFNRKELGLPPYGDFSTNAQNYIKKALKSKLRDQTPAKIDAALKDLYSKFNKETGDGREVRAISDTLKTAWEGQVEVSTDPEATKEYMVEQGNDPKHIDDLLERSYGFTYGDFVHINPEGVAADTPIHELGHIWNGLMQNKSPEVFDKIFEKIKQEAPEIYQEQIQRLKDAEYDLEEGSFDYKDEIVAGIIGYHGQAKLSNKYPKAHSLEGLIHEYWTKVKELLGFEFEGKDIQDLNVEQMLDLIVNEIATGKPGKNIDKLSKQGWVQDGLSKKSEKAFKEINTEAQALDELGKAYQESGDINAAIAKVYQNFINEIQLQDFLDLASKITKAEPTIPNAVKEAEFIEENSTPQPESEIPLEERAGQAIERKSSSKISNFLNKYLVPPSAEDFKGMLYRLSGNQKDLDLFIENLLNPYVAGVEAFKTKRLKATKILNGALKGLGYNALTSHNTKIADDASARDYIRTGKSGNQRIIDYVDGLSEIDNGKFMEHVLEQNSDDPIPAQLFSYLNKQKRKPFIQKFLDNRDTMLMKDGKIRPEITKKYGEKFASDLYKITKRMERGTNRSQGEADSDTTAVFDFINQSNAVIMFLNSRSAALQMLSTLNYVRPAFTKNPVGAIKNYGKAFKYLAKSDYIKDRFAGASFDVSADDLINQSATSWLGRKINAAGKFGFLPTKVFDAAAIISGGALYLASTVDQHGGNFDAAMADFANFTEENQQSSDPSRISNTQASGMGRVLFSFLNTPFQYTRIVKRSVQDLANRRGSDADNVAKIVYFGAAQSAMFTAAQQAINYLDFFDDEEDEKEKQKLEYAVDGFITTNLKTTFGLTGVGLNAGYNLYNEFQAQAEGGRRVNPYALASKALDVSPPISRKLRSIRNVGTSLYKQNRKDIIENGLSSPKLWEAVTDAGDVFNLPSSRIYDKIDNLHTAFDSPDITAWQRVLKAAGYSDYSLGIEKEKSGGGLEGSLDQGSLESGSLESPLQKGTVGQAHSDGTIEVDPNQSPEEIQKTIAHEEQHVKDMEQNGLDYDDNYVYYKGNKHKRSGGQIEYNGKMLPEGDQGLPWEAKAHDAESPLYREKQKPKAGKATYNYGQGDFTVDKADRSEENLAKYEEYKKQFAIQRPGVEPLDIDNVARIGFKTPAQSLLTTRSSTRGGDHTKNRVSEPTLQDLETLGLLDNDIIKRAYPGLFE